MLNIPTRGRPMPNASNLPDVVDEQPPDWSKLPLWQQRYLGALAAGLTDTEAAHTANCTTASVRQWTTPHGARYHPQFARAVQLAMQGRALLGVEALRARAVAYGSVAIDDAFKESRDKEIHARDRLGNRRLVLETAGAVGSSSQGAAATVPSILINISVGDGQGQRRTAVVVDATPLPTSTSTPLLIQGKAGDK